MPAMSRCFDPDCDGRDVRVASVRLAGSTVHYLQLRCARCETVLALVETRVETRMGALAEDEPDDAMFQARGPA